MGLKANSHHFRGTNGTQCKPKVTTKEPMHHNSKMPKGRSQIKHIFRDGEGHLPDTLENRKRLIALANDRTSFHGMDEHGVEWYAKTEENGKQLWVTVRNGVIQNGGENDVPIEYSPGLGLKKKFIERKKNNGK